MLFCCFFIKQKTAYEMRIGDWSSDVCSSDLDTGRNPAYPRFILLLTRSSTTVGSASVLVSPRAEYSFSAILRRIRRMILPERVFGRPGAHRSEERVGGTGCDS